MDNNLQNTQLDDQKMESLRKRIKLSKYIMIAGGVCLGIIVLIFLVRITVSSAKMASPTAELRGIRPGEIKINMIKKFTVLGGFWRVKDQESRPHGQVLSAQADGTSGIYKIIYSYSDRSPFRIWKNNYTRTLL